MKQNVFTIIRIVSAVSAMTVVISSGIYLFTQKMIPGVSPFALAILMLSMFLKEKVNGNKAGITWIYLLASVLNIAAGINQILAAC